MKALGELDQPSFGTLAGATKSVVNQWLSGKIKSIDARYAFMLQKNTGFNAEWIMLGGNCPERTSGGVIVDSKRVKPSDLFVSGNQSWDGKAIYPSVEQTIGAPDTIEKIVECARSMSPQGQYVLLGRAEELAARYPAAKANQAG